jgi:hypothetical protein
MASWKVGDRAGHAAFQARFGEGGEETFDGAEPGNGRQGEAEGPEGMTREPAAAGRDACGRRNCRGCRGRSCRWELILDHAPS